MAPTTATEGNLINISAVAEYDFCSFNEGCKMAVNLHLSTSNKNSNNNEEGDDDSTVEQRRQPVDIVVVLDRSGSMGGKKLSLCQKTIRFLIKELSSQDRLSLITYDTLVTNEMCLTKMNEAGKQKAESIVNRLRSGSCTNLSGGLFAGIEEVQNATREDNDLPNPVKSVLLLTDGLANVGISSTAEIAKTLEAGSLLQNDVSLFTFGYGSDHNTEMLREISDIGRGVYYYIQSLDGVSLAFADCLGGLLSVVAQNITLEIAAKNGASIVNVKTARRASKRSSRVISLGDLYDEEERDVLLNIRMPVVDCVRTESYVDFTLTYVNVLEGKFETCTTELCVDRSDGNQEAEPNKLVLEQKSRVFVAEAIENARELASHGQLKSGRKCLDKASDALSLEMDKLSIGGKDYAQALLSDLLECKCSIQNERVFNEEGRHTMASKTQSHFAQRSNNINFSIGALTVTGPKTSEAAAAAAAPANLYRTAKKTSTMSKALRHS